MSTRKVAVMKTFEKIRLLREEHQWTQEEMAGKLSLSVNGYAKIERGETRLNLPRLEQIAELFEIDIVELIQSENTQYSVGNLNNQCSGDISYHNYQNSTTELEKLRLVVQHQSEMLAKQADELAVLKEMLALLKKQYAE